MPTAARCSELVDAPWVRGQPSGTIAPERLRALPRRRRHRLARLTARRCGKGGPDARARVADEWGAHCYGAHRVRIAWSRSWSGEDRARARPRSAGPATSSSARRAGPRRRGYWLRPAPGAVGLRSGAESATCWRLRLTYRSRPSSDDGTLVGRPCTNSAPSPPRSRQVTPPVTWPSCSGLLRSCRRRLSLSRARRLPCTGR